MFLNVHPVCLIKISNSPVFSHKWSYLFHNASSPNHYNALLCLSRVQYNINWCKWTVNEVVQTFICKCTRFVICKRPVNVNAMSAAIVRWERCTLVMRMPVTLLLLWLLFLLLLLSLYIFLNNKARIKKKIKIKPYRTNVSLQGQSLLYFLKCILI